MLNLLDLIELQNLGDPPVARDELPLCTHLQDLFTKGMQVDREIVNTREDICKEAGRRLELNHGHDFGSAPRQERNIVCYQLGDNSFGYTLDEDDLFGNFVRQF